MDGHVVLEPEEIDAIKLESKRTIDLVQFVDAKDIDYRYFERPCFLVPGDQMAGEGYAVIRDALCKTGKVGLGQVTISGREWLVAVAPLEDGLVMEKCGTQKTCAIRPSTWTRCRARSRRRR